MLIQDYNIYLFKQLIQYKKRGNQPFGRFPLFHSHFPNVSILSNRIVRRVSELCQCLALLLNSKGKTNGTLKRECTDHIIPLNEKHISNHLADYIHNYYNTNRPHESLDGQTPIPTPKHIPIKVEDVKLKATPVMNGIYHTYKRTA